MTWNVTAKGWVGLCPVWLAEIDSDAPVPIPRPQWLGWWLWANFFAQDCANFVLDYFGFDCCYVFRKVQEVEPFEFKVE